VAHDVASAVPGLDEARLQALREQEERRFAERTARSAELVARARRRLPNGVPMSWMGNLYPHGPLMVESGEGPRFRDVDGNEYLDFNLCDLSMPAGFSPAPIVEAIRRQAGRGVQFLLPSEDAEVVAEQLEARFGLPLWQVTLSASTANVEALRLARLATGRARVLLFGGRYHGHIDDTLGGWHDGVEDREGLGLPPSAGRDTTLVDFNDLDAVEQELARGNVAAVLTEPVLTNCTLVHPTRAFTKVYGSSAASTGRCWSSTRRTPSSRCTAAGRGVSACSPTS
jgi:glutamate-1-semialdehyde 2,1-aminomutase